MGLAQAKQATQPKSIFGGIKEAEAYPTRNFFNADKDLGEYKLEVIRLVSGTGKLSGKGFLSADLKVLDAPDGSTKRVGSEVSVSITENANAKYRDYFLKDSKRMVAAILNQDLCDIDEEAVEQASGEDNPCQGAMVYCTVTANTKEDTGKTYTRTSFTAVG